MTGRWRIKRDEFRPHTGRDAPDGAVRSVHFVILDDRDRVIATVDWLAAHPRTLAEAAAHAREIVEAHNEKEVNHD